MYDPHDTPPLAVRLRTRALWWLMRAIPYPRLAAWHAGGRLRPVERLLLGGDLILLGGLAPRLRLSGAHFAPWGAQAFTVLTGVHEPMVQEALRRSLGPGGSFLDIGANIGATSLLAAVLVGPEGSVTALDPQRECVAAVRANAARNGFRHVQAVEAAVSAEDGEAEVIVVADALWTRLASVGEHPLEARRDRVRAVSVDGLLECREIPVPDVVKVDVEGAELDVVAGMHGLLSGRRPVVICEMHGKNCAFCDAMEALGYRVTDLDGPGPVRTGGANTHAFCEPA
ncbi:MAG: FkbM family methyltransferase [Solirubrobacterales bacterium]|nr:FkbM family methyltransferase [Solirubrobacterales bacterium]